LSLFPRTGHEPTDAWAEECEAAYQARWGGRDGDILVITGSRRHPDLAMVERYLRWYFPQLPAGTVIRTGGAEGVDQLAERIADELGLPTETIEPEYHRYPNNKRQAPLDRNTVIVEGGTCWDTWWRPAVRLLAFPDNLEGRGGTWDTIRKGQARIPTAVVGPDGTKLKQTGHTLAR